MNIKNFNKKIQNKGINEGFSPKDLSLYEKSDYLYSVATIITSMTDLSDL